MMDANDFQGSSQISHYESNILNIDANILKRYLQLEAFDSMEQLEGWCTKSKASILMDIIFMLNPKVIVEIGVWGGKSLIPMAYALKNTEEGKIYGIDPWDNVKSVEGMEGIHYEWWSNVDHQRILSGLENKIRRLGLSNQIELIKTSSELAPPILDIDVLHIDGNHSEEASNLDVRKWVPLVRRGGVIIFVDTDWKTSQTAVNWLNENCIKWAQFYDESRWGMWIKS
jgi:predicted O-methyltransferase YrrM